MMKRIHCVVFLYCALFVVLSTFTYAAEATGSTCGDVSSSLTLTSDITDHTGTCFVIRSNNVVLDGGGYQITGSSGVAVNISGFGNVTVKNFGFIYNFSVSFLLISAENNTIFNNTMNTTASPPSEDDIDGTAIFLSVSNSNNITNNSIFTSGDNAFGIAAEQDVPHNVYHQNYIETLGSEAAGLSLYIASQNNFTSNTVITQGDTATAVALGESSSNYVASNTLTSYNSNVVSIYFEEGSAADSNVVHNNVLSKTVSSSAETLRLSNVEDTNITFNRINFNGGDAINFVQGVNFTHILSNVIIGNGGLAVSVSENSENVTVEYNNITVASNHYAIQAIGSSNIPEGLSISHNRITQNASTSNLAVRLFVTRHVNVTDNVINGSYQLLGLQDVNHSVISGNTLIATNPNYELNIQGSYDVSLVDQVAQNSSFSVSDLLFRTTGIGEVSYHDIFSQVVGNLSKTVSIESNSILVNVTLANNFNAPANLTFYGTNALDYSNRTPFRNGVACDSTECVELVDADTYVFNVTGFASSPTFSVGAGYADIDADGIGDDSDTLVGTAGTIVSSGLTNLEINISGGSPSGSFVGTHVVSVNSSGKMIVNFTHDFSDISIDLSRVTISQQGSSLIVNMSGQINYTKTLWIDDSGLVSLCAKDAAITSLSEISAGCTGSNEYDFTSCIGSPTAVVSGPLTCVDEGSRIRIENLSHSGVRGTQGARFTGIEVTKGETGSFTESTAGNDTSQGGNLTILNFSSDASTIKWQGYYGETEVSLAVGVGGNTLFSFGSAPNEQIKSVMATTDNNFNFPQIQAASAGDIDTTWGFSATDSDSGTLTLDDGTAVIAGVTGVPYASLNAYTSSGTATTYQSGVVKDDGSVAESSFGTLGFIVSVVPDQTDFANNTQVDFELIVPVNNTAGSQTYYFFLDIS